jgi:hypothetical protein
LSEPVHDGAERAMLARVGEVLDIAAPGWRLAEVRASGPNRTIAAISVDERRTASVLESLERSGFVRLRDAAGGGAALAYDAAADSWLTVRLGSTAAADGRTPLLRRGLGVCLLAPDGAGKSTLAAALGATLPLPVSAIHMELYGRAEGRRGVPGLRLAVRIGRQWRRWLDARVRQSRGALVVFDRYPYDALLPPSGDIGALDRIRRAVLGHVLPAPDLALVLDVPAEMLHARKDERTVADLERLRHAYRALTARLSCSTAVVDASGDAATVRRVVTERIWSALLDRERARRNSSTGRP